LGQKVNPIGLRLGITRTWDSKWFAEKDYADLLHEDIYIRKFVKEKLFHAGISRVEIERAADKVKIFIWTAKPGIIIGKKGEAVDAVRKDLQDKIKKQVFIKIKEIRNAETDAQLVAENIALQLQRRISFRRAMKKAVGSAMKFKAKGIKVICSGRLGGAEMARTEKYRDGRVPLHTLRADIDYGYYTALTTYGTIGVKVWIYHGDIHERDRDEGQARAVTALLKKKRREAGPDSQQRRRRTLQEMKKKQ
jgi:small subunit ribosomal protein S3